MTIFGAVNPAITEKCCACFQMTVADEPAQGQLVCVQGVNAMLRYFAGDGDDSTAPALAFAVG